MTAAPREQAEHLESGLALPAGTGERFNGYGVMGLPFASGHVLALRRFPASSVGPGYSSVWHRTPAGAWVFYATVAPRQACTRYFGALASEAIEADIQVEWPGPFSLKVAIPAAPLEWQVAVAPTPATRLMNAAGSLLPRAAWRHPTVLGIMGRMAGPMLGVGRVGLQGFVPNGQRFVANPRVMWAVTESRAVLTGEDFGPPGPVTPQAHLGDFWIPQRGMLAFGQAYFETFDPARHSSRGFAMDSSGRGAQR